MSVLSFSRAFFVACLAFTLLSGCATPLEPVGASAKAASSGSGPFNGAWKLKLTPKKDTCGFGISNAINTDVTVVQKKNKATLTIKGLPKYTGTIDGNVMNAAGKYSDSSGLKTNGSVVVTLSRDKKTFKLSKAKIDVKSATLNCYVTFGGSGKR